MTRYWELDLDRCWTEHDVCVLDVETCGLKPEDGVCDIAAVRFSGGRAVDSFTSFVSPGRPIPAEATAIHGIHDEHVAGAPTLDMLAPDLLRIASGAVPCAYSADFDRGFIQHVIRGVECAAFDPTFVNWLDVLVVVRDVDRYTPGHGRHRLLNACARRGLRIDGAHRALPDATATGQLLYSMLERDEIKPCPLVKLLRHIGRRKEEQERDFQSWLAKQPRREGAPA